MHCTLKLQPYRGVISPRNTSKKTDLENKSFPQGLRTSGAGPVMCQDAVSRDLGELDYTHRACSLQSAPPHFLVPISNQIYRNLCLPVTRDEDIRYLRDFYLHEQTRLLLLQKLTTQ